MRLSVRRALFYDYPAFLGCMFAVLSIGSLALPSYRHMFWHGEVMIIITVVWTLSWLALSAWRVARLARLFRIGRVAPARITNASRGFNGPVTYDFTFDEDESPVNVSMYVTTWVDWRSLTDDEQLQALYDPDWIFRAVILQLFQVPPRPGADDALHAA